MKLITALVAIIALASCDFPNKCIGFSGRGRDIIKRDTLKLDTATHYYLPHFSKMSFAYGNNEMFFKQTEDTVRLRLAAISTERKSTDCGEETSSIWVLHQEEVVSYSNNLGIIRKKRNEGLFEYDFTKTKSWKDIVVVIINTAQFVIPLDGKHDAQAVFHPTYTLGGLQYNDVYHCKRKVGYPESPSEVFYNTRNGLLAFRLATGELYVRK